MMMCHHHNRNHCPLLFIGLLWHLSHSQGGTDEIWDIIIIYHHLHHAERRRPVKKLSAVIRHSSNQTSNKTNLS